tara:strand:+ start:1786 stop:2199 length:414 start_codon:yes stop_codon:yes gene_type:complete
MERYYSDPDYRKAILLRNKFRYHNYYKHNYKVPRYENLLEEEQKKQYIDKLRLKFYEEMIKTQNEMLDKEAEVLKSLDEKRKEYQRQYYITKKTEELDKMIKTNTIPEFKKRGRKPKQYSNEFKIEIVNTPRFVQFK